MACSYFICVFNQTPPVPTQALLLTLFWHLKFTLLLLKNLQGLPITSLDTSQTGIEDFLISG